MFQDLLKEAFHSYQVYIQTTGVLNTHSAKLSLLKWPDVAQAAIDCIEEKTDDKIGLLKKDLEVATFAPIAAIHSSAMARVNEVAGKHPPEAVEAVKLADRIKSEDPIKAKRVLISSINQMFMVLGTMSGIKYPKISENLHD